MIKANLLCHPHSAGTHINSLAAEACFLTQSALRLSYTLTGAITRLSIPKPQISAATDGLWRHTCFEAFIGLADSNSSAYAEFNFSPSSQWAAYAFSDYRIRSTNTVNQQAPQISVTQTDNHLLLTTDLELPDEFIAGTLQIGLTAVIEDNDGNLSYWALHHPAGTPDFHHRDGLILSLTPNPLY